MKSPGKAEMILIDAKYLLWRAVTANPEDPVGLWFHFFIQSKLLNLVEGGAMIVCWDDDENETVRRKRYPDYKRARGESRMYELARIARVAKRDIHQALQHTAIPQATAWLWEADDVIGTLVKQLSTPDNTIFIFSSDHDFYQILGNRVYLINLKKKDKYTFIGQEDVEAEMGVKVDQVHLLKAVMGDSSDGIPGIKGIGPKKGAKLLHEHDFDLKAVAQACDFSYKQLKAYRWLVSIKNDVKIDWMKGTPNAKELIQFMLSIGSKTIIRGNQYKKLYDE